jgi:hypothetical protein
MIIESVMWVTLALIALPLARLAETPVNERWPGAWPFLRDLAPWMAGLGPAYLALIRGAVLARIYGLYGRGGAAGWAASLLLCAAILAVVWALRRRLFSRTLNQDLASILLDEPRWALYRAAGVLWFGPWGLLAGLAIGVVEWGLRTASWRADRRAEPATWQVLLRLSLSTLVFALTGNVWLTGLTQVATWSMFRPAEGAPRQAM